MIVSLNPITALPLVGRSYKREEGCLLTSCPGCGDHGMRVLGPSLVCPNPNCSFSRGSAVDLLAFEFEGSYEEALAVAAEAEPYFADKIATEARYHRRLRNLLEFAIDAERQNSKTDIERLELRNEFQLTTSVAGSAMPRAHWFLTTEQMNRLDWLLLELDIQTPPNFTGRAASVAAYWGNHHTPATLVVTHRGMRSLRRVELFPFRTSWFGLPQLYPGIESVDVFPDYTQALASEPYFKLHDPDRLPVAAIVNPRHSSPGAIFSDLRFRLDNHLWRKALPLWSYSAGFENASFVCPDGVARDLADTMVHLAESDLRSRQFEDFIAVCAAVKMNNHVRSRLLDMAHVMNDRRLANELVNTLSRKLLDSSDKGKIFACPSGYELETGDKVKPITNFTLDFTAIVCFSEHEDLLYEGKAYIGSSVIPFECPGRKLDAPGHLEGLLRNLQLLRDDTSTGEALVSVKSHRDFKRVIEILKGRMDLLPRTRGVRNLGWTRRHDTFIMPTAVVTSEGVTGGVRYHADAQGDLHCFTSDLPVAELPPEMPEINPYLAELVSAVTAQVMRAHHGMTIRPFPILNNMLGRSRGLRLFQGFGQTKPLHLTGFVNRNIELNRGMPCIIANLNELQAEKLQMAGVWLAPKGLDLGRFSEEEIESASLLLPALVTDLCLKILSEGLDFQERRSVRPLSAMADEGARLIRRVWYPQWPEAGSTWSVLDQMLEINEPSLADKVFVDDRDDSLILTPALWEENGLDITDIVISLGQLCVRAEINDNHIAVDRHSGMLVLEDFYGQPPRLKSQKV